MATARQRKSRQSAVIAGALLSLVLFSLWGVPALLFGQKREKAGAFGASFN